MALTPSEERAMREIERQLEVNDPKFVERLQGILVNRAPHWIAGVVIMGVSIGFALAAHGAPGPQVMSAVGFLVAGWLFGRTGWHGLLLTAVRARVHLRHMLAGVSDRIHRMAHSKLIHRRRGHGGRRRSDRT